LYERILLRPPVIKIHAYIKAKVLGIPSLGTVAHVRHLAPSNKNLGPCNFPPKKNLAVSGHEINKIYSGVLGSLSKLFVSFIH
jgi:hypothetical protein